MTLRQTNHNSHFGSPQIQIQVRADRYTSGLFPKLKSRDRRIIRRGVARRSISGQVLSTLVSLSRFAAQRLRHDLGRVNSHHFTLRRRVSSSIGIFVSIEFVGVASCPANQTSRFRGCPVPSVEQTFQRIKKLANSEQLFARSGRSNQRSTWPSVRVSASAARNTSSTASASRMPAPFSSSAPKCSNDGRI